MDKRFIAEKWFAPERRMHPFQRSRGAGRPVTADTLGDPLFQWFSTAIGLGVVGLLVLITVILTLAAQDSIRTFGLGFLTGNVWNPVPPLVFGAVPFNQREAALSLGATRWETTRVAVLRYARAGIFGAIILGLGRAVGETMAVTMTIGNRNAISISLFDQGQTIASWIANNFLNATDPLELSALIELGLVLMLMSLVINIFARLMIGRVLRRGEGAA